MELMRPIVRVGNSAGVILPKEWLNGKARVELVEKPLNIKRDVLELLEPYLDDIQGIYLVGSYARGEQTDRSDVDVLVITDDVNKKIKQGKYEIIFIPKGKVEKALENSAFPIIPMLREAKSIMNNELIDNYRKYPLTKKNLHWAIELAKSAMKINRKSIDLDRDWPSNCSDATAYSLVLRLRERYIVDCIRKNKLWSTKGLLALIKRIASSLKAYEGYLRVKEDRKKDLEELPIREAESLYNYIVKKLKDEERWLARKS